MAYNVRMLILFYIVTISTNCRTVLTMLYYRHDYCTEIAGWHTEF